MRPYEPVLKETVMAKRETLIRLLDEYNSVLERLREESQKILQDDAQAELSRRAIANQLSYLEYKVLQIETQLSILSMNVRRSSRGRSGHQSVGGLLTQLNPWHPNFRVWSYVTVLAILMLSVIIWNIVSSYSFI